jgi:hypothetical protein
MPARFEPSSGAPRGGELRRIGYTPNEKRIHMCECADDLCVDDRENRRRCPRRILKEAAITGQ